MAAEEGSSSATASPISLKQRQPTLYDVAKLAGVSHQTVSRYLRGGSPLRPGTVERVAQAVAKLHYTPNLAARALRTQEPDKILVIVPDDSIHVPTKMLSGARSVALAGGYRVETVTLDRDAAVVESQLRRALTASDVAGVLSFAPLVTSGVRQSPTQPPLVVAGDYDDALRAPGALADGGPTAMVVRHLASLGHAHFFHLAGPLSWPAARSRAAVYTETIIEMGVTSHGIEYGDWTISSGHAAGQRIATLEQVTAVVAANDHMAIGAMRALYELGLKVPGDISVIGWDDVEESSFLIPSLSTVRMDHEALGGRSMMDLLRRVGKAPRTAMPTLARSEILLRESVGPPRERAGRFCSMP
ncbi:UNVERIFIED_ORG: DNA-binding LacI/PurR family transcriptional regulator [Paenarthrobacter nicotinovorans]